MSPVIIPEHLPATEKLNNENIFVMNKKRATTQDIRPLQVLILNLMPTKIVTETQILRLLSNNLIQLELTFMQMASYESKNTPKSHLDSFYSTFKDVYDKRFDAMIVTGAPIELMEFEDVDYWREFTDILDWAHEKIHSCMFICWSAQAALYHYYGINKRTLKEKVFGIYNHKVINKTAKLTRGFDDFFDAPHSRNTEIIKEQLLENEDIEIIAESDLVGPHIIASKDRRRLFITGHPEYDKDTLNLEYIRDINKGLDIKVPHSYYINDNPENDINVTWRSHANLLYANWINYYVYQETDFDLNKK